MANVSAHQCSGETCSLVAPGHGVTYTAVRLHRQAEARRVTVLEIHGQQATLGYDDGSAVEVVWWHRPLGDHIAVGQSLRRREPGVIQSDDGHLMWVANVVS